MTTFNPGVGNFGNDMPTESRVSILAIIALVCSLICIIPGLGALGAILGVVAMIAIGASGGRVSGRGMAVAAIILGLLFSMLWIGLFWGAASLGNMFGKHLLAPARQSMTSIDAGDWTAARAALSPPASGATDAQLAAFRDAYRAELGAFQRVPEGSLELVRSYMALAPAYEAMQRQFPNVGGAQPDMFPAPGQFERGGAIILIDTSDPAGQSPTPGAIPSFPVENIIIFTANGTRIDLIPAAAATPAPGTTPAPATPGEAPTTPPTNPPTTPPTTPPATPAPAGGTLPPG